MKPTVVLLHGLARTHLSLSGLRRHIERLGYPTWSRTYPSRRQPIEALADQLAERIQRELPDQELIAVTHSLGGVLVRHIGDRVPFERVLMLAPPNQGSQVAERLQTLPVFRWFFGPAARDVALCDGWPGPHAPVSVIAGTRGVSVSNPPSMFIHGLKVFPQGEEHDGTVTVAETRLDDMVDFATVPASHTWIMNHPDTKAMIDDFLATGRFGQRGEAA